MISLNKNQGFTLVELLVVISIIGVLIGMSVFGLQGARESSRDSSRKADLELVRSAIEIYRSDCNSYPLDLTSPLIGDDSSNSCLSTNTYMAEVPDDPTSPNRSYLYYSDGGTYEICSALEQTQSGGSVTCGGSTNCVETCNYKVVNP